MRARSIMRSNICSAGKAGRSSKPFAATRVPRAIRRAPRTSTMSISPPARSGLVLRRLCSPLSSRVPGAPTAGGSSGSVGLGVAQTLFASLVQHYVRAHGWGLKRHEGRMIALVGDAELDEGNVFEAILEGWKQGLRNCWWIID